MFVTKPEYVQFVPAELAAKDDRFWQAVTLTSSTPWYLLATTVKEGTSSIVQTTIVAWESTLRAILEHQAGSIVCVYVMMPAEAPGAWSLCSLNEVWAASSDDENSGSGPLLFLKGGAAVLENCFSRPVTGYRPNRHLLFRAYA